ncbi:uncharacterized protein BO95DRAFT_28243 [Aspergillus brunneoviolaceus CBS 621.78]|uniref:Uncharacterized protein n=1 Tax=Aspergillus brunneoviolaceus CBS 621.78 TaxID=1450534 RepID=A0ACD1GIR5_9EURO|nr:hypothetical protein BO95DRAFT_28243 [Aspergillus brunneoviolaceus CBS 621.78]RAH49137.1 hypothetical protein BO95DRAFT_28243 [Aspergillus brunneoviolaceus CBS 621.78]
MTLQLRERERESKRERELFVGDEVRVECGASRKAARSHWIAVSGSFLSLSPTLGLGFSNSFPTTSILDIYPLHSGLGSTFIFRLSAPRHKPWSCTMTYPALPLVSTESLSDHHHHHHHHLTDSQTPPTYSLCFHLHDLMIIFDSNSVSKADIAMDADYL